MSKISPKRRLVLRTAVATTGLALTGRMSQVLAEGQAPAIITREGNRPQLPYGAMSGDITADRAIVWSRSDRPARLIVDYAPNENMKGARRIMGPAAMESTDYSARVDLAGLPSGQTIFYRAQFQDLENPGVYSEPVTGRFATAPGARRSLTFTFSGDEAGQGWGINEAWGGYRVYEAMRKMNPDFFIHSGDQIYADGPIQAEMKLEDGSMWKNLVTPAKSKVAETLEDYRGNFAYNLLDANKRRFAAEVPFLVQWDDHETKNNWFPGQDVQGDKRYRQPSASLLAAYARRAMFDFNPIRPDPDERERVYRRFAYGPLLEVFMLDERSYRGANSANRQAAPGPDAAFLGARQLLWLKQALLASTATWKVIASDMPIGLVVADANAYVEKGGYEAWANADDGAPAGRELELASLF